MSDRVKTIDRETIVVSESPESLVQIDIFPATGGDLYVVLTPRNARTIGREIVKTADAIEARRRRR